MKKLLNFLTRGRLEDTPVAANQVVIPKPTRAEPAPTQRAVSKDFSALGLIEPLVRAVRGEGYETPTPIQAAAIPHVLKGQDLLGCAQTGTGKTAAFALPILQRLAESNRPVRGIKTLVLTPTRELALQIAESFTTYGAHLPFKTLVVFGGVGIEPQKKGLRNHPDILVATPGRFLDLYGQRCIDLDQVSIFVLDEADRMLDMGFIHDVKRIIALLPKVRQNLLFSATMPKDIQNLAMSVLKNPAKVEVTPVSSTSERVAQKIYFVSRADKRELLLHVLEREGMTRALVFTRTKAIANRVSEFLCKNSVRAEAIHGNKSQSARQRALENFKAGKTRVLVASDLAARGLDVDGISHVVNFDLPNVPETYVHRIGRTGRAAATGDAVSFCDHDERPLLTAIERTIKMKVPVESDHPFAANSNARHEPGPASNRPRQDHSRHGSRQRPEAPRAASAAGQSQPSSPSRNGKRRRRRRGGGSGGPQGQGPSGAPRE